MKSLEVLIQTVNSKEFYAVMTRLNNKEPVQRYRVNDPYNPEKVREYFVGKCSEKNIPVVVVQTNMGGDEQYGSYNETKVALSHLPNLKYIFAVGVCGGVKAKTHLGLVVVSSEIHDYSTSKEEDDQLEIRSSIHYCTDGNFYHFISRTANHPDNTVCGIVLSANKVVKSDNFQNKLLQARPTAIAFEMEGHGIVKACRHANRNIEILVIKGVCDFADLHKNDGWQPQAAVNAADVLCQAIGKFDSFGKLTV